MVIWPETRQKYKASDRRYAEKMIEITACKPDLERIIRIIQGALKIDVAIFDLQSRLIACTRDYLKQKGETVHAPSIDEVVAHGDVMVNKPGHMPACAGCRFLGNCPAKIEILRSIRTDTAAAPLGVITFTSFTAEGHQRITRETDVYVDALNLFSNWIAELISQKSRHSKIDETEQLLGTAMNLSCASMLTIDPKGAVTRCNPKALKLFSFCDLYTRSAFHILPEAIVDKILDAHHLKETRVMINNSQAFITARPIFNNDLFNGAILSIEHTRSSASRPDRSQDLPEPPPSLDAILGNSPCIHSIKQMVTRLARSCSTILITGETGTGKGLLAKAIHHTSTRSRGPFVPVNCASIPDTLFESELFGYEEGAFTGAKKGGKPGRFELAQGGTLFLDEIGEMPLHMQVKLLNVLQDHALQRVGGIAVTPIDVRVIAATNQDLESLVKEKGFRADLFYRLNVIPMDLPPLADRREDIEILAAAFLKKSNQTAGKKILGISAPVMGAFLAHNWPGNIRELQNIIEYSVNMENSRTLTLESLPQRFLDSRNTVPVTEPTGYAPALSPDIRSTAIAAQTKAILSCLDRYGHDVQGKTRTARELGISLRTLYRKLNIRGN
jgi:transcriptional regulator with PAS, ATPase and Fis domain